MYECSNVAMKQCDNGTIETTETLPSFNFFRIFAQLRG